MLMAHDVMGMINSTAGVPSQKVCGFDSDGDKETDGFNPAAMSFHRHAGDIVLERCRGGRSCSCLGGVSTGHSGLIIINHSSGCMIMAGAAVISFREAKAAGPE